MSPADVALLVTLVAMLETRSSAGARAHARLLRRRYAEICR